MLGRLGAALAVCFVIAVMTISSVYAETAGGQPAKIEQTAKLEQDFEALSAGKRPEPDRTYNSPEQPTVYLTFDDGPGKLTGQVLDILKQEGVHATFFVIGKLAQDEEGLLKRTAEEGHAIGNHSFDHVYKDLYGNFGAFWEQVQKSDAIIEQATGSKPTLIRAPGGTFGNFDPFYFYYLEEAGYSAIDWNIDSGDASRRGVPADEIVRTVKQSPLQHELVVLMHDGIGHEETVKALPEIIQYFKEKGYAFAPLSSETKPVQFPSGKSRWNRSYSYESFLEDADRALALGQERSAGKDSEPRRQLALEGSKRDRQPLSVAPGAFPQVPDEGRYEFGFERFSVSLRDLTERLGGNISWDDSNRRALVQIGPRTVQYDPFRKQVRVFEPGSLPKISYLADLQLIDGRIRVPLRGTAELFGGRVHRFLSGDGFQLADFFFIEQHSRV